MMEAYSKNAPDNAHIPLKYAIVGVAKMQNAIIGLREREVG